MMCCATSRACPTNPSDSSGSTTITRPRTCTRSSRSWCAKRARVGSFAATTFTGRVSWPRCLRPLAATRSTCRAWGPRAASGSCKCANVEVGQYLAVPFHFDERRALVNERLIAGCLQLPNLFPVPLDELSRRVAVAAWLTDPNHVFYEVWLNQTLCGI